jgi:hypothetical protein
MARTGASRIYTFVADGDEVVDMLAKERDQLRVELPAGFFFEKGADLLHGPRLFTDIEGVMSCKGQLDALLGAMESYDFERAVGIIERWERLLSQKS